MSRQFKFLWSFSRSISTCISAVSLITVTTHVAYVFLELAYWFLLHPFKCQDLWRTYTIVFENYQPEMNWTMRQWNLGKAKPSLLVSWDKNIPWNLEIFNFYWHISTHIYQMTLSVSNRNGPMQSSIINHHWGSKWKKTGPEHISCFPSSSSILIYQHRFT